MPNKILCSERVNIALYTDAATAVLRNSVGNATLVFVTDLDRVHDDPIIDHDHKVSPAIDHDHKVSPALKYLQVIPTAREMQHLSL